MLGVLPAIYALICWSKVRSHYRGQWNPAAPYLNWGAALAVLGLLNSSLIVAMFLLTFVFDIFN